MRPFQERSRHFEALAADPGLIRMGQNTNHLPGHPAVRRAMAAAIENEVWRAYAPPAGLPALRALIRDDLGAADAEVLVTDGAAAGLHHLCHHLLEPGERMIVTDPGWPWPEAFCRAAGAALAALPIYEAEQGYRLTAAQLRAAVADGGAKLIYLVDPLNPLGICYTEEEVRAFAQIARDAGAWLVHDCTYRKFARRHTLAFPYYPERTVLTYSFSKWLGLAGLRVGALAARPDVIEALAEGQPNPLGSNVVGQLGAVAGLETKDAWFPEVQRVQRANQEAIRAAALPIDGIDLPVFPSDGNFLAIDVSGAGAAPETVVALYRARGIMIRHAGYQSRRYADRFVKVSTTVPESDARRFCDLLPEVVEEARGQAGLGGRLY